MKKRTLNITLLAFFAILTICVTSCSKVKVGYLRTTGASFTPDSMIVVRNLDTTSDRYINKTPWVSTRIQGVAGTNPLNYEFAGVEVSEGGDATVFEQLVKEKRIKVDGGLVLVFQDAVEKLTNGKYDISIKVYNDDHSSVLKNAFKVIVQDYE